MFAVVCLRNVVDLLVTVEKLVRETLRKEIELRLEGAGGY